MRSRRLFTRRHSRGPSFFGGLSAAALAGALVLVMLSPAHAPTARHSALQVQAATVAPPPVVAIPVAPPAPPAPVAAPAPPRPRTCPPSVPQHTCYYPPPP